MLGAVKVCLVMPVLRASEIPDKRDSSSEMLSS